MLRHLAKMAGAGRSIGDLIDDLQAGKLDIRGEDALRGGEKQASSPVVDLLFEGDLASADAMIDRLAERISPLELVERMIEPALVDVGERWFRGEAQIFQERYATSSLLCRLVGMLDHARRANTHPTRSVLVGTVHGDHHEGGVLMISLALELAGWRALPLGVDLPTDEFQKAIDLWRPDALALSFVLSRNINKRFQELSGIHGVPVFVGGRSIVNHQGLARRHGLIPLIGSLRSASNRLIEQFNGSKRPEGPSPLLG